MSESEYHRESAKRVTLAWLEVERAVRACVGSVVTSFSDADDVTQSVAMTVVERFGDFDESRPLLPWVLGIVRFKLKEYIRSRRRAGWSSMNRLLTNLKQPISKSRMRSDLDPVP